MGLLRLIVFLKSGLGIFLVTAVIIGCCLPDSWLEVFGMLIAIGIIGIIAFYIISLFR